MVISQLRSVEIHFKYEIRALIMLSLFDSWNTTVIAINNSSKSTSLTFNGVCDLIISEDICRREFGKTVLATLVRESRGC